MEGIPKETLDKIVDVLTKRGVGPACPRCGHNAFVLVPDGYVTNVIQPTDLAKIAVAGQHIPAIALVCQNCGFISQHSLIVLDLLPRKEETKR